MPLLTQNGSTIETDLLSDSSANSESPCTAIINQDNGTNKPDTTQPETPQVNCKWLYNWLQKEWVPWAVAAGFGILWITKGSN